MAMNPTSGSNTSLFRKDSIDLRISLAETRYSDCRHEKDEDIGFLVENTTSSGKATTAKRMKRSEEYNALYKRLDIKVENINYSVKTGIFHRENKHILKGLSGTFRSGELSAIIGPSGAGKTTFAKIFSGYTEVGYSGEIKINGFPRDTKLFRTHSSFVMQETTLQYELTVFELMNFAANLKIGNTMTENAKRDKVENILKTIDMYKSRNKKAGILSGGEKRRLAIALELISNPPVLILDEPTSGLDAFWANQCISMLKKIANEGRTVICTIHQPSALAFSIFDHLYAIAEGRCIYSGAPQNVVTFLAKLNLHCPKSYNPADYLMEIASHVYGEYNQQLVEKINNGKNENFRLQKIDHVLQLGISSEADNTTLRENKMLSTFSLLAENDSDYKILPTLNFCDNNTNRVKEFNAKDAERSATISSCSSKDKPKIQLDANDMCQQRHTYVISLNQQAKILIIRTFLILWRNKSLATLRVAIHLSMGSLIGIMYYGIGNDASNALNSFRYIYFSLLFIMYQAFSAILVKFPSEFPIVSREHFNRWYSFSAYYMALTLSDIPTQFICTSSFVVISYFLSNQPLELFRICLFGLMLFLTALVAQSLGLAVGASFSIKKAAILGPFFISPFVVFSAFFLQLKDAQPWMQWLFDISFLKYSFEGSTLAVFGYDRPKLECSQIYCHFTRPKTLLKEVGMANADYQFAVLVLLSVFIIFRIIAFFILSFRLRLLK